MNDNVDEYREMFKHYPQDRLDNWINARWCCDCEKIKTPACPNADTLPYDDACIEFVANDLYDIAMQVQVMRKLEDI